MGYEIKYTYHPRKEEGSGYNEEITEEKKAKVGKPFDDTPLEKCAAAIMAQLARRDVWVIDVEVFELVKKEISFKESKDGKGIVLRNKKFSLNQTAQLVAEDVVEATTPAPQPQPQQALIPAPQPPAQLAPQPGAHPHEQLQPHEIAAQAPPTENPNDLYSNPNKPTAVRRSVDPRTINKQQVLYHVIFEPYSYIAEARAMKLKFRENVRYPVHAVIPSPTGKLDAQQIAVSDETGQVVIIDEKFFTSAGRGLVGDAELNFSGPAREAGPKLSFADQMFDEGQHPEEHRAAAVAAMGNGAYKKLRQGGDQAVPMDIPGDIPLDDGSIPDELLQMPNLR